jgi:hypothetical protein
VVNPIQRENLELGTRDWLLTTLEPVAAGDDDDRYRRRRGIEGYVARTSVRAGEVLTAYVSTEPPQRYRVDVYRMGYYGGTGARRVATLGPFEGRVQAEPAARAQQLVEASWQPSFELRIEDDWQSGVYLAKLTTLGSGLQSYLVWVVRDDRQAELLLQVSDLTWQAYNRWPGWRSLYDWKDDRWHNEPQGAMVSFDRPYGLYYNELPARFVPATNGSGEFLLWEFPLVYWLEQHGYDVTYTSGLDTHQDGDGLRRARGFISVGHDEYYSRRMFDNLTRARDAGVSLAFLSGNAVDAEIAIEAASDGRPDRRFQRFASRGGSNEFEDEHELMGATSYGVGLGDWTVRAPEHWLLAGTGLRAGDTLPQLVGWEYQGPPLRQDPSLVVLASGPVVDQRGARQTPDFAATVYETPSGGVVFNAATCWWALQLASPPGFTSPPGRDFSPDPRVQRVTENLLARMIRR